MTSTSISITKEVYDLLDKARLKNESFSQAIKRLLENQVDIISLGGAWKKITDAGPVIDIVRKVVNKIHDDEDTVIRMV
jgi:predicted CopG family antitoxin